jgi:ABC-2 type transport system ATP-binding protein
MAGPASAGANAVEVTALTKRFGNVAAVDGISFTLPRGRCLGLLGGNGAGKTTTIAILLGLVLPDGGSVRVLGQDMLQDRFAVLPRINFSSPYSDLPHRLTVRENLGVFARLYGVKHIGQRIAELTEELHLGDLLDRRTGALSSGQKARVSLAKALVNRPELLLLDEPTASLDPDTADWVRGRLEAARHETGAAILLASHNMGEVERLCDAVLMMQKGRIVDGGAPAELAQRYGHDDLESAFLTMARGGVANPVEVSP